MAFENTMTEMEMDPKAQQMIQNLRSEGQSYEPDLDVEGMSPSILSRIIGLFSRAS
ncbi:MAG: hypothetical protein ACR2QS_08780 [Woeseiaceae bacterium]